MSIDSLNIKFLSPQRGERTKVRGGLILLFFLLFFSRLHAATVKGMRYVMGTTLRVEIHGDSEQGLKNAMEGIFNEVKKLDRFLSSYDDRSEISRLGAAAPQWMDVSRPTLKVLLLSRQWAERTEGAFEPTIWPLVKLWGFDTRRLHEPSDDEIERIRPLLDYRQIELDLGRSRARLTRKGAQIDLGAIGKGFALEEAKPFLEKSKAASAVLDFGGELLFWSNPSTSLRAGGESQPLWKVSIRGPGPASGDTKESVGEFKMIAPGAVSTSSNGERFLEDPSGKKRFGHVLNPKTGWPAEGAESVTVVAADGTTADVLSTAVFVSGVRRGLRLIDSLTGTAAAIFFRDSKGVRRWVTSKDWSTLTRESEWH